MIKITILVVVLLTTLTFIPQLYVIMAKTETQPYKVVKIEKDFEIRLYAPATMASVSMKVNSYKELSSVGFRKLASYIFGGNTDNKNIAMTAPVHMDINDSMSSMSFVMPANFNKNNLPNPNDSMITIKTTPGEYVAALGFGGYANDDDIKTYSNKLDHALKISGYTHYGNFRFLGYNAPYQFWGRKNEIIVSIYWK